MATYICRTCKKEKDELDFARRRHGEEHRCRACCRKSDKQWRERNPEKVKAKNKSAYQKWREKNPVIEKPVRVNEQGRLCNTCKTRSPDSNFLSDLRAADGLCIHCAPCMRERHKAWRDKNAPYVRHTKKNETRERRAGLSEEARDARRQENRKWRWLSVYGLTCEAVDELMRLQNGVCSICRVVLQFSKTRSDPGAPCIDHCHSDGRVRGILCKRCNTGLGNFEDNPARFRSAAAYLETGGPNLA